MAPRYTSHCRRQGFCPACVGWHMVQIAAYLVERVIPWDQARHRVVSVPMPWRYEKVAQVGAQDGGFPGGKCRVNCLYSLREFCLPWSNNGRFQVCSIYVPVRYSAPITHYDDERTPYAKL
jgi:hypothetical protein